MFSRRKNRGQLNSEFEDSETRELTLAQARQSSEDHVLIVLISMRIQALMSSWPFLGDQLRPNSKFKSEHILHASARYILVSTCLSQSFDPIFSNPGPAE